MPGHITLRLSATEIRRINAVKKLLNIKTSSKAVLEVVRRYPRLVKELENTKVALANSQDEHNTLIELLQARDDLNEMIRISLKEKMKC